jgi:hypothetical protein
MGSYSTGAWPSHQFNAMLARFYRLKKRNQMSSKFIAMLVSLVASSVMLVGCSDSPTPTPTAPADTSWASPAVFVPAGQSELRVPLSACDNGLRTATLVIDNAGNLSLNGAVSGTSVITEINRVNFADTVQSYFRSQIVGGSYSLVVSGLKSGGELIQLRTDAGNSFKSNNGAGLIYTCTFSAGAVDFQIKPSQARIAEKLLSGITSVTTTGVVTGTFANGIVNWDNWASGASGSVDDEAIRYLSLNISTAAMRASTTLGGVGTVINFDLPAGSTSDYYYLEIRAYGIQGFTGVLSMPSSAQLDIFFERSGNTLAPYTAYVD